jgi:PAS domain S-box-containing protein
MIQPETGLDERARDDAAEFVDLLDDLDAMVWEYDVATRRYSYVSAAVERLLGYPAERWTDDPDLSRSVRHPEDRARIEARYEAIEREGGRHRLEYRAVAAEGRERWMRDLVHVVDSAGGRRVVRGMSLDVSQDRAAEAARAETEARYRSLVEQIPAITYVWGAEGAGSEDPRTYVSPQIEGILGFPPHEWLVDRDLWTSRVHPDDARLVLAEWNRCARSGDAFHAEYRMIAHDGRIVWLRDEAHVVARAATGEPELWQGVMFDITERRGIESERHTLLVRLVQAQEEERRRIASDVHDDSIQKMAAVGIRLEALRMRVDDPDVRAAVEELHRSVGLSIGRLRRLLFELRPPSLDRDGLVTALREYLDQAASEGGFACSLHNGLHREPPIEVRTIAYRIAQEALANVRKHARATRIDVRLEQRGDGFAVRIDDDGRGLDDPGARTGRPGQRGLATMRERAELASGWLTLRSPATSGDVADAGAAVGGTSVEFWLPFEDGAGGIHGVR